MSGAMLKEGMLESLGAIESIIGIAFSLYHSKLIRELQGATLDNFELYIKVSKVLKFLEEAAKQGHTFVLGVGNGFW